MVSTYNDGSANAPTGTLLLPTLLAGYPAIPPWQVAGVNYAVGVPTGTTLLNPASISIAGVSINAASHTITVTGNNVTLNGYDFSLGGGWGISIASGATNTVIENSNFLVGSNNSVPVNAGSGVGNLTVQDDTFNGGGGTSGAVWAMVNYNGSGTFVAKYDSFLNTPSDAIDFSSGTMTTIVEYNVFENLGTNPGAHADTVQYDGVKSNNSVIAFNTVTSGEEGIQLCAQGSGSILTNTTIDNNVIVAKGPSVTISYSIAVQEASGDTVNGVVVDDNYIDLTGSYGAFYPPAGTNLTYSGNVNMTTGASLASPSGTSSTDVSSVTAAPASGTQALGSTISISLHMDEAEFVTGTPTLALNDGGTATYVGGSGSTTLLFSYTVSSTDKVESALAITGVSLPTGASIKDAYGNAANLAGATATFSGLGISPGTSSGPSPTAVADGAVTSENQAVTIAVLTNDSGGGGTINPASVAVSSAAAHGTTAVNATTGAITYTPTTGYYGTDTFQYTVADTDGVASAAATVTVTVDSPPVAAADSAVTPENQAVTIAVLANDSDPVGTINPASVAVSTAAAHGTTAVNATTGAITYTPASGYYGSDTFRYTVANTLGIASTPATVTVTVEPPTAAPIAAADSAVTAENQAVSIAVLANDSGGGGTINPASVAVSTAAAHGTTAVNATTGAIIYTPTTGYSGTDTFQYTVADTDGEGSTPATVTVTVNQSTTSSGYADGASGAPTGTPQLPAILGSYAVRPPWEVAGVDYAVGVPTGTTLLNPATIAMAGVSVNTTNHTVTVTGNNVTLNGYDFSLSNGYEVIVEGANDTVENSNFVVGSNQGSNGTVLDVTSSASNFSLIGNNINGNNVAVTAQVGQTVSISSSGALTIRYNYLHNSGGDMIDLNASTAPQIDIIQYNLFANIGVNTAHSDTIQWYDTQTGAGSDIGFNTVYENIDQPGPGNGALVPLAEGPTATMTGLTVNNDTIIQTAADTDANFSTGFETDSGGVASDIVIHDLYIDPTGPLGYTGSPWFPTGYYGDNLAHPTALSNVIDMVTGAQVPVPSASTKTSQGYYTYADASGYSPSLSDVYSITPSQASGTLTQGNTVTFAVNTDENFTVTGTPTLTLNDGGTAAYSGGSGTNALTFTYTVGASNTAVSALAVTGVSLPGGATVRDSVGNAANLAGALATFAGLGVNPGSSNPSPVAVADGAATAENQAVMIAVLANDTGGGGTINPASVAVSTGAAHGTTAVNATTGAITYTPTAGYYGTDTFRYTVADTDGVASAPATVTVTVEAPPTAAADSAVTPENQAVTIAVLAKDTDANGTINPASVEVSTAAGHGTTAVNATTGAITYTPASGYYGTDTFRYTVANTLGGVSAPATVTVTVEPPTAAPIAAADSAVTPENQAVSIAVLANDSGGGGTINPASVAVSTAAAHGTTAVNAATGAITYTPTTGYFGTDTFQYTVADTDGEGSTPATVTITVEAPPVGQVYTLSTGPETVVGGNGPNTVVAPSNTLLAGDVIEAGSSGTNTLVAQGAGTFDLSAPTTLSNIQTADVEGAAAGQSQFIYLRTGLDLTLNVLDSANIMLIGAANNDIIKLGAANAIVYLGGPGETVVGGTGNEMFCVTAATIGATIKGGTGTNSLQVESGGTVTMGSNITNVSQVTLTNAPVYDFTANATAGLTISAGTGSDTIAVGAASQTVVGSSGTLTVQATASEAGINVETGSAGATLDITTGGAATLNSGDTNLTVQLNASTNLGLGGLGFITAIGSAAGNDTITAGGTNQTLESISGSDTLVGSATFGDTFLGTSAGLSGDTIRGFGGSDAIDITDMISGNVQPYVFNAAKDQLTVTNGTHSVTVTFAGSYNVNSFAAPVSDSHTGTLIKFA